MAWVGRSGLVGSLQLGRSADPNPTFKFTPPYEHQMERSVDPKLSSAVRKVAKQKLEKWQPQLDKLTEVASELVQMSLPCPDVPSLSSSCATD